jgi:hypothetical protein
MKYLENFEDNTKIKLEDEDFTNIDNLLLDRIKENDLTPDIDTIYSEFELLKKDKMNSFIFHIVKKYLKDNGQDSGIQNIMKTSAKFFEIKYGEVIKKFRAHRKAEFDIDNDINGNHIMLSDGDEIIKVPSRIGHNYIPMKILPMEQLHTKFSRHKRLKTFHEKGLKCVRCPKEGCYLIAAKDIGGAIHIDVYTKEFDLMTVDHIKPKSKGGSYNIENLDPMCQKCNTKKSNKYEEEVEETEE